MRYLIDIEKYFQSIKLSDFHILIHLIILLVHRIDHTIGKMWICNCLTVNENAQFMDKL